MTRYKRRRTVTVALLLGTVGATSPVAASECVVLLHGLARTATAMAPLVSPLEAAGYTVVNVDYPSREAPIETLAPQAVEQGVASCNDAQPVNFVTHSLGGILVRYYAEHYPTPWMGRAVMLAPPNQGSEVVDELREVPGFELLNGPAGLQLGTDDDSIPSQLGPVTFELGVIAGTSTFNPLLSQLLPNPDDGKVSVASARVDGMVGFATVDRSHTFIMRAPEVAELVLHFLRQGRFPSG